MFVLESAGRPCLGGREARHAGARGHSLVVAVADVCGRNKQLKWILLVHVQLPTLDLLLQLPHTLFPVPEK